LFFLVIAAKTFIHTGTHAEYI